MEGFIMPQLHSRKRTAPNAFLMGTPKNLAFENAGSGSSIKNTTKPTNKTGVFMMKVEDSKPTLWCR